MTTVNVDLQLRSVVDRIVRLTGEKRGLSDDIRDIYTEAKSNGYDAAALRIVVKRAMEDAEARQKRETVEQIAASMEAALGEYAGTPLGAAAMERAAA